jgi:hypothetical protein
VQSFAQLLAERLRNGSGEDERAYPRQLRLRSRGKRPCGRCADSANEIPPIHARLLA